MRIKYNLINYIHKQRKGRFLKKIIIIYIDKNSQIKLKLSIKERQTVNCFPSHNRRAISECIHLGNNIFEYLRFSINILSSIYIK
jgi:hypothetical protein